MKREIFTQMLWGTVSSSVLVTEWEEEDGVDETILSITILQSPQIDQNIRIFMKLILLKTFYTHFPFNKFFSINECQNLTNNEILRCNLPETYILDSVISKITIGVSFSNVERITLHIGLVQGAK